VVAGNTPVGRSYPAPARPVSDDVGVTPLARIRTILIGATLAGTLLLAGCTGTLTPGVTASGDPAGARRQLDELTVGTPQSMAGYSRDRFRHWVEQGNGCDTRELVLKRDGTGVAVDDRCKAVSGTWVSPYDNRSTTDPTTLDIDHMVPLANAWRSGASAWTDEQRSQFANDLVRPQLLAVTAGVNRAKGDQDPSQWKPPNVAYRCQYAQRWIAVKRYWKLTVTVAEKAALVEMLGSCG
jgi:Protein of unknown function (DUF1524)